MGNGKIHQAAQSQCVRYTDRAKQLIKIKWKYTKNNRCFWEKKANPRKQ